MAPSPSGYFTVSRRGLIISQGRTAEYGRFWGVYEIGKNYADLQWNFKGWKYEIMIGRLKWDMFGFPYHYTWKKNIYVKK